VWLYPVASKDALAKENHHQADQKHDDRDAVDTVHHAQVEAGRIFRVMWAKYTYEISAYFAQSKEIFYFTPHNRCF
jgi:hypothetical protein